MQKVLFNGMDEHESRAVLKQAVNWLDIKMIVDSIHESDAFFILADNTIDWITRTFTSGFERFTDMLVEGRVEPIAACNHIKQCLEAYIADAGDLSSETSKDSQGAISELKFKTNCRDVERILKAIMKIPHVNDSLASCQQDAFRLLSESGDFPMGTQDLIILSIAATLELMCEGMMRFDESYKGKVASMGVSVEDYIERTQGPDAVDMGDFSFFDSLFT